MDKSEQWVLVQCAGLCICGTTGLALHRGPEAVGVRRGRDPGETPQGTTRVVPCGYVYVYFRRPRRPMIC
jgi:hypothetical protein